MNSAVIDLDNISWKQHLAEILEFVNLFFLCTYRDKHILEAGGSGNMPRTGSPGSKQDLGNVAPPV